MDRENALEDDGVAAYFVNWGETQGGVRGGHRGLTLSDIDGHRGAVLVTRWGMGQATLTRFLYVYNAEVLNFMSDGLIWLVDFACYF